MAKDIPCVVCDKTYDLPKSAVQNSEATFFLTKDDMAQLRLLYRNASNKKLVQFLFISKDIANYRQNHNNDLRVVINNGSIPEVRQYHKEKEDFYLKGLLTGYNMNLYGFVPTDGPDKVPIYREEKTIIRTMTDRNLNIKYLVWVIKRAHQNNTGMNAFFLHKNSFVWISLSEPPKRSSQEQLIADRDVQLLTDQLLKFYTFKRKNFPDINKLMYGTGRVEYYPYPRLGWFHRPEMRVTGPKCSLCGRSFSVPKDAILNAPSKMEPQYYLTTGDLAALTKVKNDSFEGNVARIGFINRIVSNVGPQREIASRVDKGNIDFVSQPVTNTYWGGFIRGFNIRKNGAADQLWDAHRGESTLFRTMPDRNANIKDLVWVIQTAHKQQTEMNAFFLHKRHFLWVKVFAPPTTATFDHVRSNILMPYLRKDLLRFWTLRKRTIPAINDLLVGRAQVAYHTYPDNTWMEAITEETSQNKAMYLTAAGILISLIGPGIQAQGAKFFNQAQEMFKKESPSEKQEEKTRQQKIDEEAAIKMRRHAYHRKVTKHARDNTKWGEPEICYYNSSREEEPMKGACVDLNKDFVSDGYFEPRLPENIAAEEEEKKEEQRRDEQADEEYKQHKRPWQLKEEAEQRESGNISVCYFNSATHEPVEGCHDLNMKPNGELYRPKLNDPKNADAEDVAPEEEKKTYEQRRDEQADKDMERSRRNWEETREERHKQYGDPRVCYYDSSRDEPIEGCHDMNIKPNGGVYYPRLGDPDYVATPIVYEEVQDEPASARFAHWDTKAKPETIGDYDGISEAEVQKADMAAEPFRTVGGKPIMKDAPADNMGTTPNVPEFLTARPVPIRTTTPIDTVRPTPAAAIGRNVGR